MSERKIYLVTGATGGIGKAIVKALSQQRNALIIMAVRNPQRAMDYALQLDVDGCEFRAEELDLGNLASVDRLVRKFNDEGIRFTALINNAGTMPGEIIKTADGYESATQVNYVATRRLTEGLLSLVVDGGAIVFTTSMTRRIARCRDDWREHSLKFKGVGRRFITYGRSKRMLTAWARQLSEELAPRRIRVNCADPGIVDTGIITMGNPIVDHLATWLFRPLIYSPQQGATPALRAVSTTETCCIFTLKGKRPNTIES